MKRPVWVDVDLRALFSNAKKIKEVVGDSVKIVAVLKQFAYGHGFTPVARKLYGAGVDFFGVSSVDEAIVLREDGYFGRILLLSIAADVPASYYIRYNITPIIVDLGLALKLNDQAKKTGQAVPVHVKVDTGMGRLGLYPDQMFSFLEKLKQLKFILLEGICTHIPVADTDFDFTNNQLKIFRNLIDQLKTKGIDFKYSHCSNSIGVINYPNSYFNMVRPGLILYGVKPSFNVDIEVSPVLSFKSKVIFIKEVFKGSTVGYGADFVAQTNRRIATVSVGYADGYPWALSNRSKVLIRGEFFKIAGRVCMDHIMVDLGQNQEIKEGDTVTLIGRDQDKEIKAQDLACWAKTIPYEIVTCIARNIPRRYLT